ncbi:3'-5' exonuclease [Marinomonas sp. C2222]|uniref:3'-5' exonuclease n=1 Tax=Marinomonas sargassi TaxID=2984494 RepID=A0ABT2YRD5_9GAMM|nr:3'-5' exonuclease [Marinomonas sargassi]MCV2402458.1 3'-5' exonuclease [Marinomonas sargassi]
MKNLLNRFHQINQLEKRRAALLAKDNLPGIIAKLLKQPYPTPDSKLKDLEFLVFDLETTGLDPKEDRILSIGYLEIKDMRVDISTSVHTYIQAEKYVKAEAAVINHIVPEMLSSGQPFDEAMEALFLAMQGKVLIAHGTVVEKNFIDAYVKRRYDLEPLPLLWLDTLLLEKSLLRNKSDSGSGDYQLASVRERHNLPPYHAHNALSDSIATGELFLVLTKIIHGKSPASLRGVYKAIHDN